MTLPNPADSLTALIPAVPGDWILQGGAIGLLAFVALLIFLGRLIPSTTYKQLERDRDYWRAAAMKAIGHTDALLPAAQITTEVTRALAAEVSSVGSSVGSSVERAVERALGGAPPPEKQAP